MKRGGSLSFLVGTISNVLVMEIGWTDVGSGGYILVSYAHSNTSLYYFVLQAYICIKISMHSGPKKTGRGLKIQVDLITEKKL